MAEKFLLKDHLFNAESVGQLAAEFAAAVPGFDSDRFVSEALAGFPERELLQRLDWLADCLEPQLAPSFPAMADQLEAALPSPLDPKRGDDDFGKFIHAVPGILAVRHGLEHHRERALDLLHAVTQRFSMEFYIRPFLNRWPEETLARLRRWAEDENYHVRRLVSEGTRPKLPWAKAVRLSPDQTLPLLDRLHADPTRYVTRSVANHLNDLAKAAPDLVLERLATWEKAGQQNAREMDWMRRHALRTLVKQGHEGAMDALGYRPDLTLAARVELAPGPVRIDAALTFTVEILTRDAAPVLVDYVLWLPKANGSSVPKVFKLKSGRTEAGAPLVLAKTHRLKGDATTFRLHPGPARIGVQVNGRIVAEAEFVLERA